MRKAGIYLLRVGAWLAALPYVAIVLLVLTGPPSWSAVAYLAGMGALVFGLITLNLRGQKKTWRPRGLARGAALSIAIIAVIRGCSGRAGDHLHYADDSPRIAARLLPESDVALSGTRVLVAGGALKDDANELPSAMRDAYAQMKEEEGDFPSPVLTTYLGMQSANDFDLLLFEPTSKSETRATATTTEDAVIFLHGFAGNFSLPCWQMARAVRSLDVITACPSTRWVGDWWRPEGQAILEKTIATLHARGVKRIILSGLSNGGYGASRLAPKMKGKFVGLILISGAASEAGAPGVPILLLHGRKDSMAGFGEAVRYQAAHGGKLVALDAGHFSMLVRSKQNDDAVRSFAVSVFGRAPTSSHQTMNDRSQPLAGSVKKARNPADI